MAFVINELHTSVCWIDHGRHINVDDAAALQPCLACSPLEVIKKSIENTTQYDLTMVWHPVRMHWNSCFKRSLQNHLKEPVSTDDFKGNTTSYGRYNCVQVFFGVLSFMINVHGMKKQKHFICAHQNFL